MLIFYCEIAIDRKKDHHQGQSVPVRFYVQLTEVGVGAYISANLLILRDS